MTSNKQQAQAKMKEYRMSRAHTRTEREGEWNFFGIREHITGMHAIDILFQAAPSHSSFHQREREWALIFEQ